MYKKILVPLDGSALSEAVIPQAEALAKSEGAEIIILRVPNLPSADLFSRSPAMAIGVAEDMEIEVDKYLQEEVNKLRQDGVKVSSVLREGPVAETILAVAEEAHADVIAMSTHGRTGMQRWLMGSVAEQIVRHAHVPVMLVHPN